MIIRMNKTLVFLLIIAFPPLSIIEAYTDIIISEVLKNPEGNEGDCPGGKSHEFIELYNVGTDTLSIQDIFISDGTAIDSVIPWIKPIDWHKNCRFGRYCIPPGQFALILDRDYINSPLGSYFTIADSAIILTVDKSSLLGGLTANRGLFLYFGTRKVIQKSLAFFLNPNQTVSLNNKLVQTEPKNIKEGYSISPSQILFSPVQYRPCPESLNLGRFDSEKNGWLFEYKFPVQTPITSIVCSVSVCGINKINSGKVHWTLKNTMTSSSIQTGIIKQEKYPVFFTITIPKDSVAYSFLLEENNKVVEFPISISLIWLPVSPIKINELFPRATSFLPEWIELFNTSPMPVNLKNWQVGTPEGKDIVSNVDLILEPGHFLILTKDRTLFSTLYQIGIKVAQPLHWQSLQNYRDTVFLYNPLSENPSETVCYNSDWFDNWDNQSIARVSTKKSGLERSTWTITGDISPGLPNSDLLWLSAKKQDLYIGPIPFTPNNDNDDDLLLIKLQLPESQKISVAIYGFNGKIIFELPLIKAGTYKWNGKKSDGSWASVGPFFVVATFDNGGKETKIRKKGILWR